MHQNHTQQNCIYAKSIQLSSHVMSKSFFLNQVSDFSSYLHDLRSKVYVFNISYTIYACIFHTCFVNKTKYTKSSTRGGGGGGCIHCLTWLLRGGLVRCDVSDHDFFFPHQIISNRNPYKFAIAWYRSGSSTTGNLHNRKPPRDFRWYIEWSHEQTRDIFPGNASVERKWKKKEKDNMEYKKNRKPPLHYIWWKCHMNKLTYIFCSWHFWNGRNNMKWVEMKLLNSIQFIFHISRMKLQMKSLILV